MVAEWRDDIREHRQRQGAIFVRVPLSRTAAGDDRLQQTLPGNSIRMPLMSMFADLDGYTAYIDQAAANRTVADAVRALHVIRSELQSTFEDDFGGRKVRFIGDRMHGMLAEGTSTAVNAASSIRPRCGALVASVPRSTSVGSCCPELPGWAQR